MPTNMLWIWMTVLTSVSCLYEDTDRVEVLTEKTLESRIPQDAMLWIIHLYTPGCERSKQVQPEFIQVSQELEHLVHFGALDLSTVSDPSLVQKYNVQGTPEFLIFKDPPMANPYKNTNYRAHVLYSSDNNGATHSLDRRSLKKYIKAAMPNYVDYIDSKTDKQPIPDSPSVILFTTNIKIAPLFKAVSAYYYDEDVKFVHRRIEEESDEKVLAQYGVDDVDALPILVMTMTKNEPMHLFDKSSKNIQKWGDILEFIDSGIRLSGKKGKAKVSSPINSGQDFQKTLEKTSSGIIVLFRYADSSVDDDSEEMWKKRLKTVENRYGHLVRLFDVYCDAGENIELCKRYATQSLWCVFPFTSTKPREFQSEQVQTATSFEEALVMIERSIPSNTDILTSDADVNTFVLKCVNVKKMPIILLSKKYTPPPMLKALSVEYSESANFALFPDPPPDVLQQYQVPKLPAIVTVFEQPGDEQQDPAQPARFAVAKYHKEQMGPMNFRNVGRFISAVSYEVYPQQAESTIKDPSVSATPSQTLDDIPLATADNFQKYCLDSAVLCAIGVFKPSSESIGGQPTEMITVLEEIAKQTQKSGDPVQFLWMDGLCQHEFVGQFDVSDIKIPTLVLFSPRKLRYATFLGQFTAKSGRDFVRSVVTGRLGTHSLVNGLSHPISTDRDCVAFHHASKIDVSFSENPEDEEDADDLMEEIRQEEEKRKAELEQQLQQELLERKQKEEKLKKEKKKKKNRKGKSGNKKKKRKKIKRNVDEL